jgi:GWxTD domain-containing protein
MRPLNRQGGLMRRLTEHSIQKSLGGLCITALLTTSAFAVELSIDALPFKADSGRVYLELYIDLPRSVLAHRQEADGKWYGAVTFMVSVQRDSLTLALDQWQVEDLADTSNEIKGAQRIVDARIYEMPPGEYEILASAVDSVSGKRLLANKTVTIPPFPDSLLTLSEIQLSNYILPSGVHPRFERGDFSIVPNPRRLFGPPGPLYYYFEIYPAKADSVPLKYDIHRFVINAGGDTVGVLPTDERSGGKPFYDVDSVSIAPLAGGVYKLAVQVETPGRPPIERTAKFFLYRLDSVATFEAKVDSAEVSAELAQVEFLLNRDQINSSKKMTPQDKKRFLDTFWRRYDDDPNTPDVPLRRVFGKRVAEADERYSNSRSPGHQTDRGRIYVLYGEPNDRDIHALDVHAKPFEVWSYSHLQGGVEFVFVDRSGLGEYTLVHSTLRGEVTNPDWYSQYVTRSGTETQK